MFYALRNPAVFELIIWIILQMSPWIAYNFYTTLVAKSFYYRLERGQSVLVEHGPGIQRVMDNMGEKQQRDLEMVAVEGIAVQE